MTKRELKRMIRDCDKVPEEVMLEALLYGINPIWEHGAKLAERVYYGETSMRDAILTLRLMPNVLRNDARGYIDGFNETLANLEALAI